MTERQEVATRPGYAAGTTIACVAGVRTGGGRGDFGRERNWPGGVREEEGTGLSRRLALPRIFRLF